MYHQHARHVEVALGVSLFFVAKTMLIKVLGRRLHPAGVELQTIFGDFSSQSLKIYNCMMKHGRITEEVSYNNCALKSKW